MPEIPVDDPAVIHDQIATPGEPLHGKKRPVDEAMLAMPGLAARRDADTVAHGQSHRRRTVHLEAPGKLSRRLAALSHNQAGAFLVAFGVLMELQHIARLVFR